VVVDQGALVAEMMVGEVVVEDPNLVEVVSKLQVEPFLEEEASRSQEVGAFRLGEILFQVALVACLRVEGALVALDEILEDLAVMVAFLLGVVRVEGACIHPSYQAEEVQE